MKVSCTALVLGFALCASPAAAQYPERAIEFVIPFDAGGSADIEGRLLAEEMSAVLGVTVAPVNRPGAGGALAYSYVNDAEPDGYTVMWTSTSILTITNLGNVPFGFDALDHIGRVEHQPLVFAVGADSPWSDIESLALECAGRDRPIQIANSGTGSTTHLGALAIMRAIGCEAVHLPIGTRRRNATVLSGEADAMVAPLTGALSLYRANRLKVLATLSAQRNAIIPDVPTALEHGFDVEFDLFRGLSVPKGTPADVRARLADAMTRAGSSEAFQRLADDLGLTVAPLTMGPFEALLQRENDRVRSIIQSDGTLTR
ncbi:MAG: tripartite tricarboxylate transporter substrate binding protein [Proteobacteria bacterium]|nr:tripartite tricarboxylate transporter substrate binding protein [Pseudomonadota bacterium]MYJ95128.1 tripartite tricarboxylate transporter substrate binding protein [Pseudomonadota bacterium]